MNDDRDAPLDDASIQRKLDAILAALTRLEGRAGSAATSVAGSAEQGDGDPQLEHLLMAGQKIAAIKEYRLRRGGGLTEAKAKVEELERRMVAQGVLLPNRFQSIPPSMFSALVLAVAAAAIIFAFLALRH